MNRTFSRLRVHRSSVTSSAARCSHPGTRWDFLLWDGVPSQAMGEKCGSISGLVNGAIAG